MAGEGSGGAKTLARITRKTALGARRSSETEREDPPGMGERADPTEGAEGPEGEAGRGQEAPPGTTLSRNKRLRRARRPDPRNSAQKLRDQPRQGDVPVLPENGRLPLQRHVLQEPRPARNQQRPVDPELLLALQPGAGRQRARPRRGPRVRAPRSLRTLRGVLPRRGRGDGALRRH